MKKYSDVIAGGCVIAFSIFIFILSFYIKRLAALANTLDARFFPRVVACLVAACGIAILYDGIQSARHFVESEKNAAGWLTEGNRCMLYSIAVTGIFIALISPLGFLLSSFLYLVAQMMILAPKEKRNYTQFIVISAISSAITYYSFIRLLHLMLPAGILG